MEIGLIKKSRKILHLCFSCDPTRFEVLSLCYTHIPMQFSASLMSVLNSPWNFCIYLIQNPFSCYLRFRYQCPNFEITEWPADSKKVSPENSYSLDIEHFKLIGASTCYLSFNIFEIIDSITRLRELIELK